MENRPKNTPYSATEGERMGQQAESTMHQAADKAREIADNLRSKDAGEIAHEARARASEVATAAADKAEQAMTATGERMSTLAQTVREKAPEGPIGDLAMNTASALEQGGTYLRESNLSDVRSDLEVMIRHHPIESMLVGLGVGYLLARSMRR